MTGTTLLTLLVGVAFATAMAGDQSAVTDQDELPIDEPENHVGQSRVETPQVVLQLKYDRGELNKIYLAQFSNQQTSWEPSVPARTNLCADLCHAGLGGSACGSSCAEMLPVGLQTALQNSNEEETRTSEAVFGEPRSAVCPTLCKNQLGEPLCDCSSLHLETSTAHNVDWSGVCNVFCVTDGYTLGGCPTCENAQTVTAVRAISPRILNTVDGWVAWCSVQCRQGLGGAACNCNRSPLQ